MMSKKKKESLKRIIAIISATLVVVALAASMILPVANAATQQQLDAAEEKKEQAKEELEKAEAEKAAAIAAYEAIDQQISDTENEIDIIQNQIEETKNDILLKEQELKIAEEELKEHEAAFMARARAMYEHSDIKYVEVLFNADSFGDFLTRIDMITQIMEYDDKVLNDLKETREKIDKAKAELEVILVQQEENSKQLEERMVTLNNSLAEKQRLMEEAMRDVEKYKAIYEAAEREEEALIKNHQREMSYDGNPVEYSGGTFVWPVPGSHRVTSQYGNRIHPVYKTTKFHTGIDIGAGYGLDIVASAEGTVTLATTNGGYGKCIVINHGSGITTLYGHCSTLLVSKGEYVTKGQRIAKVGSTGVSTGPHLHYEVRVNGATTNPLGYVK